MRNLGIALIFAGVIFFAFNVQADRHKQGGLNDMHMIMRLMDHGLGVALEGADLQMLSHIGISDKLDKDAVMHGTIMVKDGKAMIREMMEGKAMRELYKEGDFDKKVMDDLHSLGKKMLEVIEQVETIHKGVLEKESGK